MPRSSSSRPPLRLLGRLPIAAITLEAAGFLAIACMVWLDELLDVPHHVFGAPASPFRPYEAIVVSGLVLLLGVAIILYTVHLVRRLDSLIVLCAWCHRVRVKSEWVSIEEFLHVHRAETSHGICAECAARFDAKVAGAA